MSRRSVIEWDPLKPLTELFRISCGAFTKEMEVNSYLDDLTLYTSLAKDSDDLVYRARVHSIYNNSPIHQDVKHIYGEPKYLLDRRVDAFVRQVKLQKKVFDKTASYFRCRTALAYYQSGAQLQIPRSSITGIGSDLDNIYRDARNTLNGYGLWHVQKAADAIDWKGCVSLIVHGHHSMPSQIGEDVLRAINDNAGTRLIVLLQNTWETANDLVELNADLAYACLDSAASSMNYLYSVDDKAAFGERFAKSSKFLNEYNLLRHDCVYDSANNIAGSYYAMLRARRMNDLACEISSSFQSRDL